MNKKTLLLYKVRKKLTTLFFLISLFLVVLSFICSASSTCPPALITLLIIFAFIFLLLFFIFKFFDFLTRYKNDVVLNLKKIKQELDILNSFFNKFIKTNTLIDYMNFDDKRNKILSLYENLDKDDELLYKKMIKEKEKNENIINYSNARADFFTFLYNMRKKEASQLAFYLREREKEDKTKLEIVVEKIIVNLENQEEEEKKKNIDELLEIKDFKDIEEETQTNFDANLRDAYHSIRRRQILRDD